jgi:hypothetical protein
MRAKVMVELLQQHHPHIGETEALLMINNAKDEFCENTEINKGFISTFQTVAGQRLYDIGLAGDTLPGGALKIRNVWIGTEGSEILAPRLSGTLNIRDNSGP